MKALDTNVLIRYLTGDDPVQLKLARSYMHKYCSIAAPGYINLVVLSELAWVLTSYYKYTKTQIAHALESLLSVPEIRIERADIVWKTLLSYHKTNADFTDILISNMNREAGYEKTATFDKKAGKLEGFELLA